MTETPIVVAILNTSDDTVEMLRVFLEDEGFVVISAHLNAIRRGEQTLAETVGEHRPRVIIYDLAPPYDRAWIFLQHLRKFDIVKHVCWVLTSTNPDRVRQVAPDSSDESILEIIGKPYDIRAIVEAVKSCLT
jgi:DNA-binding response OmpR family regulator